MPSHLAERRSRSVETGQLAHVLLGEVALLRSPALAGKRGDNVRSSAYTPPAIDAYHACVVAAELEVDAGVELECSDEEEETAADKATATLVVCWTAVVVAGAAWLAAALEVDVADETVKEAREAITPSSKMSVWAPSLKPYKPL